MRPPSGRVLCALIGVALIGLVATDADTRFLRPFMRWPILATAAVVLLLAAIRPSPASDAQIDEHAHSSESWRWVVVVVILGAFVVDPATAGFQAADPSGVSSGLQLESLPANNGPGDLLALPLDQLVGRAQREPDSLEGRVLSVDGVLTTTPSGPRLTRLAIICCVADAIEVFAELDVSRLDTDAATATDGGWVRVTGRFDPTSARAGPNEWPDPTRLLVGSIEPISAPNPPYLFR